MARINLTKTDNGKTIDAPVGSVIVVRLPDNPTTGYQWAVDQTDPKQIALSSSTGAVAGAGIGAGGESVFEFRALQPGRTTLRLKRWRDWEGESSVKDRFDVTLDVSE